jgi:hypothetical protein
MGWAGLITAGAQVGSALIGASAQDDALDAQLKAIKQQQKRLDALDPAALARQATLQDIARRANSLLAQQQVDPALAAVRRVGAEGLLREAQQGAGQGDLLADQLFSEVRDADPKLVALKQQLLDEAKSELAAGATLPPDFQAELVRTGLERAGGAGIGTTGQGAGGVALRKLIGREGLALKQQRQNQAINLTGAAQDIENARVNILGSIFPKLKDLQTTNLARQQSIFGTGNALVPDVGITGEDVVNIELNKAGTANQLLSQKGDAAANAALAQGQLFNLLIGQGAGLATSTLQQRDQSKFNKELLAALKS